MAGAAPANACWRPACGDVHWASAANRLGGRPSARRHAAQPAPRGRTHTTLAPLHPPPHRDREGKAPLSPEKKQAALDSMASGANPNQPLLDALHDFQQQCEATFKATGE